MRLTVISIILISVLNYGISKAQTTTVTSGVFLTSKEYKKNKLIEEADCENDKEKFERHDLFSRQEFVVLHKGKKITFFKKDIYAYRDCENRVWRFYNDKEYQIVEPKSIYVYTAKKTVLGIVPTIEKEPTYYFSRGPDGEIKELTLENIKMVFADNLVFLNMITIELSSNKVIHEFDAEHKMYRINFIYKQSIK